MQSRRRQQSHNELGLTSEKEILVMEKAVAKEEMRRTSKENRRKEIEESSSYRMVNGIAICMDKYYLDPIIGFIPGVGDVLSSISSLPFIYVSMFKVRSLPLTLAVMYYTLIDVILGLIPFWIGNICDIFYKHNLKNFRLIKGFVEDDREVIKKVNKNAFFMAIAIGFMCLLIYWAVLLLKSLFSELGSLFDYIIGLFS